MNKAKKGLTILIEEPIIENREEAQLNKLIVIIDQMKIDQSSSCFSSFDQEYQEEKRKLSLINNSQLARAVNYLEGDLDHCYLPSPLRERKTDLQSLSNCFVLSPKRNKLKAHNDFSLQFEVMKLLTDTPSNKSRLIRLSNQLKHNNRYADIIPYNNNFVPYSVFDTHEASNQSEWYINASSIDGPLGEDQKLFIATQGPLLTTLGKFYQMCFTHNAHLIIMLNCFEEEGRKICEQYFPFSIGEKSTFSLNNSKVEVTLLSEEWLILNCLKKRRLLVNINGECRYIDHIQMVNWADHCAPDKEGGFDAINRLIQTVIDYREEYKSSPVIVHCCAGIGRTGTFIAIFNIIKCLLVYRSIECNKINSKPKAFLSVFTVVRTIREQRRGMVTALEQFKYIYLFVFEWFARYIEVNY